AARRALARRRRARRRGERAAASRGRSRASGRTRRRRPRASSARAVALVQAALALEPEEARLLLGHAVDELVRRVPVADRRVALLTERVVGEVVTREVVVDVLVVPVDDRVDLEIAVLEAEHAELAPRRRLRAPQPDDPAVRVELGERSLHRLDLVHLVVALDALEALLPQLAEARLL